MWKLVTSLALMFAQALPWAGGPLFACVGRDGSVCIDRGPESCGCCQHEAAATMACDDHQSACTHTSHAAADAPCDAALSSAPCDCTHELIETAPVVAATRSAVADLAVQTYSWSLASLPWGPTTSSMTMAALVQSELSALAAAPLGLLASIVIRC